MGQAKVRRENGTHREKFTVWNPKAADLALLHVPEDVRPQLRKRLSPWLATLSHTGNSQRISIEQNRCWRTAQGLALTARDPDVRYVEGAWTRCCQPHAWNVVDGYRVDLSNELFVWRSGGKDREQWYETLREYTYQGLMCLAKDVGIDDARIAHYENKQEHVSCSVTE